jgi:hypothetical protein
VGCGDPAVDFFVADYLGVADSVFVETFGEGFEVLDLDALGDARFGVNEDFEFVFQSL